MQQQPKCTLKKKEENKKKVHAKQRNSLQHFKTQCNCVTHIKLQAVNKLNGANTDILSALVIHSSAIHPINEPWESSSLSVECLLHLPAQPCLVWGDLRGEIVNPNFEHESASRGKASWILRLFLMIMVQSVWLEWWKCQPAYLSGTAWWWYGKPVRKTRTYFETRRMQLFFFFFQKQLWTYPCILCICTRMWMR